MAGSFEERKSLVKHLSNRSRKAASVGNRFLVPRVLNDHGNPLQANEAGQIKYVWDFNLKEARFLKALRDSSGNFDESCKVASADPEWAKRFLKSKDAVAYLSEEGHLSALATVADRNYVTGRLVSVANGQEDPSDNQKWALKELKDILIPKQLANLSLTQNVFQMPELSPEVAAQLKEFADRAADVQEGKLV